MTCFVKSFQYAYCRGWMGRYPGLLNFPRALSLEFVCMLGIICASLILLHLPQQHSAFAVENGRKLFPFSPPEIANIVYYKYWDDISWDYLVFCISRWKLSMWQTRLSCEPRRALQYTQYLHECIPHASFNAQHQAAAQQSFPEFISSSLISWCSCIVVWEQALQAPSPGH